MRVVVVVMLAACSFTPGTVPGREDGGPVDDDGGVGSDADRVRADAGEPGCIGSWLAPNGPSFSNARRLVNLSTPVDENDPYLSPDGLRLYFARSGDVWWTSRASTSDDWGDAAVEAALSSAAADSKLSFTKDELTVFINSSRQGTSSDVWRGTRASLDATWSWDRNYVTAINNHGDGQWDPHVSADGLELYFAPAGGGLLVQRLWVATRTALNTSFGDPQEVSVNNGLVADNDPTLTLDGRVLVWASNRTGDRGLWYATRAAPGEPWSDPRELTEVNTAGASDDGPHVSADGCELYFSSNRVGGSGADDLYVVDVN